MTEEFWFDKAAADRVVMFFEKLLVHSKGEWAGQPFVLQPWQRDDIVRPLFGWKRADGLRRYRRAYIELPRKNGKSTLAAGIGNYLLFADDEPGAEIYSAAADREQAGMVFDEAKAMVEASKALSRYGKPYKRSIVVKRTRSSYKVLSADAYTKHGLNAHGILFDELHAQPNRDLWDVLNTSTGSRRQPLMVMITTAGYDLESICWEQHEYARQVLEGVIEDPTFFAYIAAAGENDDWTDPMVWAKANPGLGVTLKLDYLEAECARALASPAYQNTFRRLHLDQWTSQEERWLPMEEWNACNAALPDLTGRVCFGGLDLATSTDIAAFVLCFPPEEDDEPFWWLPFFWIPEENMIERARRDKVPYDAWVRDGFLTATPGNVIDYGFIEAKIAELDTQYLIEEVAFDRWGATQISQDLEAAGISMVQFGQGYQSMSHPTKELLRLVKGHKLGHGGQPVLRWMADNLRVSTDAAENVKPVKATANRANTKKRIDGMVAGIMALDRALRYAPSVYESRGVIDLD